MFEMLLAPLAATVAAAAASTGLWATQPALRRREPLRLAVILSVSAAGLLALLAALFALIQAMTFGLDDFWI
jgi:hypothetical protein